MRVRIRADQVKKMSGALERAGEREIGGQLFGEQLAPSLFSVTDLTIQQRRGSVARFVVDLVQALRDAAQFFERTGRDYTRHNYIGEWHSHPSFDVRPSHVDATTMRRLVASTDFQGTFAVLMIVRLDNGVLRSAAWVFDPRRGEQQIALDVDK